MSDDANVPMDAIADQAEAVIKAAIVWRWAAEADPRMTQAEWKLYEATNAYGSEFKGVRAK